MKRVREGMRTYGRALMLAVPMTLLVVAAVAGGPLLRRFGEDQPSLAQSQAIVERMDTRMAAIAYKLDATPAPVDWEMLKEQASAVVEVPITPHLVEPEPTSVEATPATPEDLVIHGILWQDDLPVALINGQVLGKGDRIAGLTLTSITRERVTFVDADGKTTTYNVYDDLDAVFREVHQPLRQDGRELQDAATERP